MTAPTDTDARMHKALLFLKRSSDLEPAAFRHWWLDGHRRRVESLPGLRRYTASLEAAGEDAAFDGLAELWFEDAAAAAAAWHTTAGRDIDADLRAHTARIERLDVVEHRFLGGQRPAPFKLIAALKRRLDLSPEEFSTWWLERHAPLVVVFPELRRYSVNVVTNGPEAFVDGVAEVAFADLATLERVIYSTQVKDVQGDSQLHTSARYRLLVEEMPLIVR